MNSDEIEAINALTPVLAAELEIQPVITYLSAYGILADYHCEKLNSYATSQERRMKLLSLIQRIDCTFSIFLDALTNAKQQYLRNQLEIKAGIPVSEG